MDIYAAKRNSLIWALVTVELHGIDTDYLQSKSVQQFRKWNIWTQKWRFSIQHVSETVKAFYKMFLIVTCDHDKKPWNYEFAN